MANFLGGYTPPQQYQQQYQPYQQANNSVIVVPVQGESGASMYPVAAGNTVLLMDFNLKRFWIKATDINGLPSRFAAFDFSEVVKPPVQSGTTDFVSRSEFEELKQAIEKLNDLIGGKGNVPASNATPATIQPNAPAVRDIRS